MGKKDKPQISCRIPHEWMEEVKVIGEETGKTPSEIAREAIGAYLDKTDVESVQSLAKRVAALERKYQKLAQLIALS